ncbi:MULTISPECIES: phosphoribosylanthranilate isomerase [Flavobacterium]|uniref:N-(5'-phosphoribosyl)anthranilate isomerase n=1 Tax=Flavobacterium sedimenticola TaxID=3043286 RepID=A0ABT6XPW9_9FLAO|nr:phosphoribosylanthranilate isomerase [Flavobacterium sedimenticola]MDI9257142.1 phosphoribosylanthranilate isomerase [Flavobacterium sedimenticola]
MKYPENIKEIAALQPDYLGFIFYNKSPRLLETEIPILEKSIVKVGVFVNATVKEIEEEARQHQLEIIQLHGGESPDFCRSIQELELKVIKSFNIDNTFNFKILENYKTCCHYFLFDTKGNQYGGNGTVFDWKLIEQYHLDKPYFLSGGIGLESIVDLQLFFKTESARHCIALDLNSRFETQPGLKNAKSIKKFIQNIKEQL